ncbi:hypothetical protein BRADI_1g61710v3 [Brachypodium distachyon]|uniref:Uncharacterized protein n=1 Tax=Brachypodium distachyon TaxID=15368 RepID=I1H576_BRADI|nr:hypothetical protein BRADI_1g61710v3 [Brachypodium distachyon]
MDVVPSEERRYSVSSIRDAVREATGSAPGIMECNRGGGDNETQQLYQVYQCVGLDGASPVPCPPLPTPGGRCAEDQLVKFPVF